MPQIRTPDRRRERAPARALPAAVAALLVALLGGCDGDPFGLNWVANPDTALLYSLARPEINLPTAIGFTNRRLVRITSPTATGSWDVAVDTEGGELVFLPPGALNINSRARVLAMPGLTLDEVEEAPRDTTIYSATESVPVELGTTYVVRTGESTGTFGRRCVYFAKLEPLEVDAAVGTVRFVFDANPLCNDRALIPPDDG